MTKKRSEEHAMISYIQKQQRKNHKDYQNCLFAYFLSQQEPKKIAQALDDESWVEAMQEELLQLKIQKIWTLVDLPYGKKAIGTKWVYMNKKDERGIVVRNKAMLVAQGYVSHPAKAETRGVNKNGYHHNTWIVWIGWVRLPSICVIIRADGCVKSKLYEWYWKSKDVTQGNWVEMGFDYLILSSLNLMSTPVFVDPEISTQANEAQSSRVPVPLPEDPCEVIRQAYLDRTDTESEPLEDPVKTETPESPLTVAPPTSLPQSTPPTLVPILRRTARMAVRVPPMMSPGLSASMAEVAAMSESVFCKRFRSSYESLPSSSPPDLPSRKRYRVTFELVEDDDEEDEEIEESLDSENVSEDAEDEGPIAEDEDPAAGDEGLDAWDEGPGMRVESRSLEDESHGLDDESRGLDEEGHSVKSDGISLGEEEEDHLHPTTPAAVETEGFLTELGAQGVRKEFFSHRLPIVRVRVRAGEGAVTFEAIRASVILEAWTVIRIPKSSPVASHQCVQGENRD
ncbi:hypothetical protein Tco_1437921 [Tanacetum coccineum]